VAAFKDGTKAPCCWNQFCEFEAFRFVGTLQRNVGGIQERCFFRTLRVRLFLESDKLRPNPQAPARIDASGQVRLELVDPLFPVSGPNVFPLCFYNDEDVFLEVWLPWTEDRNIYSLSLVPSRFL
jgi:hypothetical protein